MSTRRGRSPAKASPMKLRSSPGRSRLVDSPLSKVASPSKSIGKKTPVRTSTPNKHNPSSSRSAKRTLINFEELDESLDKSWADIVEEEASTRSSDNNVETSTHRRKAAVPKKSSTKPKFIKTIETMEATETLYGNPKSGDRSFGKSFSASRPNRLLRGDRKRRLSGSDTQTTEGGSPKKAARMNPSSKTSTPRRRDRSTSSSEEFRVKEHWLEPTLGWCTDQKTIEKRSKEIDRAKEKPVYTRYISEVARNDRTKYQPKTPNKFIKYSRRSWDSQVRKWKRALYVWAGEEPSQSCNTSFCDTSDSEADAASEVDPMDDDENTVIKIEQKDIKGTPHLEPDAMASLLGRFDIDSQAASTLMGDESTLKAPSSRATLGPKDFSGGVH